MGCARLSFSMRPFLGPCKPAVRTGSILSVDLKLLTATVKVNRKTLKLPMEGLRPSRPLGHQVSLVHFFWNAEGTGV